MKTKRPGSSSEVSNGVVINSAQDINVGGDIVGRDKIVHVSQVSPLSGELELVDASFLDDETTLVSVTLDIKLRNASNEVAFLKQAILYVQQVWTLKPVFHTGALALPSANYDVEIPANDAPFIVAKAISQSIPPNDVDRFKLTMHCQTHHLFLANLQLIYDAANKMLTSRNLIFAQSGSSCTYPALLPEELKKAEEGTLWKTGWQASWWQRERECIRHNSIVRDETRGKEGIRNRTAQSFEAGKL
jgi:hypothetical protein